MKKFVKEFCRCGLMWGSWGGPVITAIVWLCLNKAGVIESLTVNEASLAIFTTAVMGFLAAGASAVYAIESIPKAFAGLIHGVVLYADYLGFYLLNDWITVNKIWIFTIIFVAGFLVIWLSIFIPIRIKVARMNKMLKQ